MPCCSTTRSLLQTGVVEKGARSPLTVAAPRGICTQLRLVVGRTSIVWRSIAWQDKGAGGPPSSAEKGNTGNLPRPLGFA